MRPSFTPSEPPLWRGPDRLQVDGGTLAGVDDADLRGLRRLEGSLPIELVARTDTRLGLLVSLLQLTGAIGDGPAPAATHPAIRVEGGGLIAEAALGLIGGHQAAPTEPASVLLCGEGSAEPVRPRGDVLAGMTVRHLPVYVAQRKIVAGPLVDTELGTSCMRCQHLTRCDRDPSWPILAAQLALPMPTPHARSLDVRDRVLAVVAAALAIEQLLAPPGLAATTEGTLEWNDGIVRRRSWPRHPECPLHPVRPLP